MFSLTITGRNLIALLKDRTNFIIGSATSLRGYAKNKQPCDPLDPNTPKCRRAYVDIKPPVDPYCPEPCKPYKKKSILHNIKLRVTEGGTNFGTPFRWLECKLCKPEKEEKKAPKTEETKALVKKPKQIICDEEERRGLQVAVLGADTGVGQYVSLLLKQCPYMKKLRLYESKCPDNCKRSIYNIVQDLLHINTNCLIEAFSCQNNDLERCLQSADIVLMLDSGYATRGMSLEDRFAAQAPLVKCYTEAIANECPKAFIIVGTSPIECMVPIIAETLRSTGWYNPARVLGSLAVPEMRASTMAAMSLGLEPWYTRVPCVGGTEGESLVPLFSRAVDCFEFCEQTAAKMTKYVRSADADLLHSDGNCVRRADLSEAHALTRLVTQVAQALLCHDVPKVTGFVEANTCHVVSPANYLSCEVLLNKNGICHQFAFPRHMSDKEICLLERAMDTITRNIAAANSWASQNLLEDMRRTQSAMITNFEYPRHYDHIDDCATNVSV